MNSITPRQLHHSGDRGLTLIAHEFALSSDVNIMDVYCISWSFATGNQRANFHRPNKLNLTINWLAIGPLAMSLPQSNYVHRGYLPTCRPTLNYNTASKCNFERHVLQQNT